MIDCYAQDRFFNGCFDRVHDVSMHDIHDNGKLIIATVLNLCNFSSRDSSFSGESDEKTNMINYREL